jgi:serine protease Do
VENATEIIVTLSEGKLEYEAEVIGRDQKLDMALIKIKAAGDLPIVTLGDSDTLEIGEWVMAIGNPFGLGGTVTAGIVSQKGRVIGAGPYDNFIQTDASINPGNSGGPLFNMKGEVVGINTAIIAGGQGIGFAIPVNMAKDVLVQLKEHGRVTRGWIGVSIQTLTPELARSFGLKDPSGALVSSVNPGEPAEAGGLKAGDIILSFDGKPIGVLNDLPRVVASTPPGKSVEVVVTRDNKKKTLTVKVGRKRDEGAEEVARGEDKDGAGANRVGLSVQSLTPETAKKLGLADTGGVVVSYVSPESPAADAGLRRGDVVREINRRAITGVKDYKSAVSSAKSNGEMLFLIRRRESTIYVVVKLDG